MFLCSNAISINSSKVEEIFRIERNGEFDRFNKSPYAKLKGDRRLLWHGSRCTNFGGILSQGLRIAPPEAPVNGYMFGKGVYLADISSKSAGYCQYQTSGGIGLLLLCEAELGKPILELTNAEYTAGELAKEKGCYATWGKGMTGPVGWKDAESVNKNLKGVMMVSPEQGYKLDTDTTTARHLSTPNGHRCGRSRSLLQRVYLLRCGSSPSPLSIPRQDVLTGLVLRIVHYHGHGAGGCRVAFAWHWVRSQADSIARLISWRACDMSIANPANTTVHCLDCRWYCKLGNKQTLPERHVFLPIYPFRASVASHKTPPPKPSSQQSVAQLHLSLYQGQRTSFHSRSTPAARR